MHFDAIGHIRSGYPDNFSIPRQAGLCREAPALLCFDAEKISAQNFLGLDQFSHLWVIFAFHQLKGENRAKTKVRAPRLGGEKAIGNLASRSPYRPNPIGLSCVAIKSCDFSSAGPRILVSGGDFLDFTPILDVKPYLPYSDSIEATCAFAKPSTLLVEIASSVKTVVAAMAPKRWEEILLVVTNTLAQDPRPRVLQRSRPTKTYKSRISGFDFSWFVENEVVFVTQAELYDAEILQLLYPK